MSSQPATSIGPLDDLNDVYIAAIRRAVTLDLPQLIPHSIQEAELSVEIVTAEQQRKLDSLAG